MPGRKRIVDCLANLRASNYPVASSFSEIINETGKIFESLFDAENGL